MGLVLNNGNYVKITKVDIINDDKTVRISYDIYRSYDVRREFDERFDKKHQEWIDINSIDVDSGDGNIVDTTYRIAYKHLRNNLFGDSKDV